MRVTSIILALAASWVLVGCGEPQGADLEKADPQPAADLDAGKSATTLEDWAKANPNNGAPGHGETENK